MKTQKQKRDWLAILFAALYILVTVATLRHSAAGFASIESGHVVWGYLSALAVDVGMALSATGLRKRWRWSLFLGLVISAAASTFTQLLYAVGNAAVMPVAPGANWLGDYAQLIADVRVVVLPALLPALSIVYSFAAKSQGDGDGVDVAELERELSRANARAARAIEVIRENDDKHEQQLATVRNASALLESFGAKQRAQLYLLAQGANGDGLSFAEVAEELGISETSVRNAARGLEETA